MTKKIQVTDTIINTTNRVMPDELNGHQTMFGGKILSLIDQTASIAAGKITSIPFATVSLDEVNFIQPIFLNEVYSLHCYVSGVVDRSIEVFVTIKAHDLKTNQLSVRVTGFITFALLKPGDIDIELIASNPEESYILNGFKERLDKRYKKIKNLNEMLQLLE